MRAPMLAALVLAASLLARPALSETPADPQAVVAAERAFARDGEAHGWAWAFRRHHAPGALMLSDSITEAASVLADVQGDGENKLDWRPAYAGIARSGDLGFTTGPFLQRGGDGRALGHYFTVWRRQPDGSWKWIFDGGTGVVDPAPVSADIAVPTLPVATSGAPSSDAAIAAVIDREAAFARPGNAVQKLAPHLAADVRLNREGSPAAVGKDAALVLAAADGDTRTVTLHREASLGGDLVFTLGEVRGARDDAQPLAHFARMWQHRNGAWHIVFDEVVPRPVKR